MTSAQYACHVSWEPFQLRPSTPAEGTAKPPNTPENPRVSPRLKAAGQQVGIDFTGKTDRVPNTTACHALLEYAKEKGGNLQNQLAEVIFQAYFTDGVCPDAANLVGLGQKVGLTDQEVHQVVNNQDKLKVARDKALQWSSLGITGVPSFFINGKFVFSGAQNADAFLRAFEKLAA